MRASGRLALKLIRRRIVENLYPLFRGPIDNSENLSPRRRRAALLELAAGLLPIRLYQLTPGVLDMPKFFLTTFFCFAAMSIAGFRVENCGGQDLSTDDAVAKPTDELDSELVEHFGGVPEPPKLPPPKGLRQMPKPNRTWIDPKKREVLIDGYVSLQEGMLEMFACPVGTKEHESVVAVYSWSQVAHAALLAVGAKTGSPVEFDPEFRPPTGTEIEIEVRWLDKDKRWKAARAQEWVRNVRTGKPMSYPWVFAGSKFWKDEMTGKEYYMADSGDFVCVSNFSTATLDVPAESTQSTGGLLFEVNTERVPPVGTPVRLVLKPKIKEAE